MKTATTNRKISLISLFPSTVQSPPAQGKANQDRRTDDFLNKSSKGKYGTKKKSPKAPVHPSSGGRGGVMDEGVLCLLKGRTITNSVQTKEHAFVSDGSAEQILNLSQETPCKVKRGLFASRQKTKHCGWGKDDVAEYDCMVVECDDGLSQEQQMERFKSSNIPCSMLVWSGTKSVHCVVILEKSVSKEQMEEWQCALASIFPKADKSVLSTMNKLFRIPVEVPPYAQTLLGFKGTVKNVDFERWILDRLPAALVVSAKNERPIVDAQTSLQRYWDEYGRKNRVKCPVCARKNKDSKENNLQIEHGIDGKLVFHCFRCCHTPKDHRQLLNFFLPANKKDPNQLVDLMNEEVDGKFKWHHRTKIPYQVSEKCQFILTAIDDRDLEVMLHPIYEQISRDLGMQISERKFKDAIAVLQRKNAVDPTKPNGTKVALQDGFVVDLKNPKKFSKIDSHTDFHLPISKAQWMKPGTTVLFDEACRKHLNKEDRKLLRLTFGFIFSGETIKNKQCMLIIKGPPDTGKSTLLDFLKSVLSSHACGLSVTDCLENPNLARLALGKRVAISGEVKLRAKDGTRFRSLLSGEELRVHLFYQGHDNVEHNVVFVAATNEDGWIEDSPENRKRVRVIEWNNPIPEDQMDPNFLAKLRREAPGIVARCLKEHQQFIGRRLPTTESTKKFMAEAGRNVNKVKAWVHEKRFMGGNHFWPTSYLHKIYLKETNDHTNFIHFGRLIAREFPEEWSAKKGNVRGFKLSKKIFN